MLQTDRPLTRREGIFLAWCFVACVALVSGMAGWLAHALLR